MSNILFEAEAKTPVESVSLLDQLDPPLPIPAMTELYSFPEPKGVSFVEELEKLGLTGMFSNKDEQTGRTVTYTAL